GFIFAPSKRQITIGCARQIIRELPPQVERIGVFLDTSGEEIRAVLHEVPLTGIQMHGKESPERVYQELPLAKRDSLFKIKTIFARDSPVAPRSEFVDAW